MDKTALVKISQDSYGTQVVPVGAWTSWYAKNGYFPQLRGIEVMPTSGKEALMLTGLSFRAGQPLMGSIWIGWEEAKLLAEVMWRMTHDGRFPRDEV